MTSQEVMRAALLKEADKEGGILELCSGVTKEGRRYYAYLSVLPSRYAEYIKMLGTGTVFRLADYGEILRTGWGGGPPEEVKREMQEKFGFDHDFETKNAEALAPLLALKKANAPGAAE